MLSDRMARLLWLLRDPFSVAQTRPVDQTTAARYRLEAVEAWAYALCEAATPRPGDLAAQTAGSPHGPWRLSNSPALTIALPNAFFGSLGVATLAPQHAA